MLEDYDLIASGYLNSKDLVGQYGEEVRAYLHPASVDVIYHRDRKGTHYEVAVRSFMDLALMLL